MAIKKITFDGCSVSSKQDADMNYHLGGCVPAGVIKGVGGDCAVTTSNNYITFQNGYVQVYGRRVYIESGSQVYISLDSSKYGYIILDVNMTTGLVQLTKVESSSSYPILTQQNFINGGTRYQFALAKYRKTTSSLTLDSSFKPVYITPGLREVKLVKKSINKYFEDLVNYNTINEVSFNLDDIPDDVLVTLCFTQVDTLGYGSDGQLAGSITCPKNNLYNFSYIEVRSNASFGSSGTVLFLLDGTDYTNLKVKKANPSVSNYPNCVTLSYYVIE